MRRKRSARQVGEKQDVGLVEGMLPPYQPLAEDSVQQVVDAALELLRDTGVGSEPSCRDNGNLHRRWLPG